MLLARVTLKFHWGFWARRPFASARQDTLVIPPPSMLLGAFAAGLARVLRAYTGRSIPEVIKVNGELYTFTGLFIVYNVVHEVYFRVLEGYGVSLMDLSRLFQAPYIRKDNLNDPRNWFAVRPVGKVFAPKLIVEAAYLLEPSNLEKMIKDLGVKNNIDVLKFIEASLFSITRIGPVEGIITPIKAKVHELDEPVELERDDLPPTPCPYYCVEDHVSFPRNAVIMFFYRWKDPKYWSYDPSVRKAAVNFVPYLVPHEASFLHQGIVASFTPCHILEIDRMKVYEVIDNAERHAYPTA